MTGLQEAGLRYVTQQEVARVSDLRTFVAELRAAYAEPQDLETPPRSLILREDPFRAFVAMPIYSGKHQLFITKVGAVVPQALSQHPSVHALVVVFSAQTGAPLAILDGMAITNLKCAAVSALVTDICAHEQAEVLAIIGSGVQAREQLRGVGAVRNLGEVRVYSRNPNNVREFIRRNEALAGGARWVACNSADEAVAPADIVSTTTTSTAPVVSSAALRRERLHINCMGAHTPRSRELPVDVLETSRLIVEDVEMAVAEAGEVHRHATPLARLVHLDASELREVRTAFCSTGHAFLDLLASMHVLERSGLRAELTRTE